MGGYKYMVKLEEVWRMENSYLIDWLSFTVPVDNVEV